MSLIIGKTIVNIVGAKDGSGEVYFECSDGSAFEMYHMQDCCENVRLWDVVGNIDDIKGSEVIDFSINKVDTPSDISYKPYESYTWTLFTIKTDKGTVVFRWLGESNGYYSESVYFGLTHKAI